MTYIQISKDRMNKAVEENDKVLLSYFHPKNRTPLKMNVSSYKDYVILDGKKYETQNVCYNVKRIV